MDQPIVIGDQTSGRYRQVPGGSAAIVAHSAAVLGAPACFAGFAGSDREYAAALQHLASAGVDLTQVRVGEGLRVTILVEPGGNRTMTSNNRVGTEHLAVSVDAVEEPGS